MNSRIGRFFGNVKMTTAIAALVLVSIIGSVGAVTAAIYFNTNATLARQSEENQQTHMGAAATILERRLAGSVLTWADDGGIGNFQSWAVPPFYDTEIIDSVVRVIKQDASIYVLDNASQNLISKTTSLTLADGTRAVDMVLGPDSPAYATVMAGERFFGTVPVNGVDYYATIQPIKKMSAADKLNGPVMGAIFVGTPLAQVTAEVNSALQLIAMVGGAAIIGFGLLGLLASRLLTRPLPVLVGAAARIADGEYDTDVPFTTRGNEIGAMAKAVDVFRANGLRISQMTEAEAARIIADQENRQQMMAELQSAFGVVVDAAVAGDFTRKVTAEFPDPELNSLATGVNNLVSTFNRGVSELGEVLGAMADTDLTRRMEGDYEGAFATIKSDINAVAGKLTEVVGQLRQTSGALKTATGEILSGANDLSERTTKQAATIEETSAAMEQLASTVLQNAQRARDASANAAEVTRTAEEGGKVMDAANLAMERITDSSAKISNIIGLIDDIAFQTNLLALNASVEAARAGDAGKGFAVVAVEVRRLAQSAASASSDVKTLIEQSAGEVRSGSKLVNDASSKLKAMLDAVRGNNDLLDSIARDSREQASAIEEVNTAVRTMDEMTQHNAALVEETNAAIEQTEGQAIELDRIVDVFRIEGNDEAAWQRDEDVRGLQNRLKSAASTLATRGNTALARDWEAF
ncbi:hypothetical protein GCM10007913_35840 [Devosia yakushimensis]|uniref:Methyl-accepting chemotaxis protein n=1 Tax=Devosia yakushimensis TaxID=470028 RepID=A0ABQ5UJW6_9HYPH|nr:methyl-accepting chemotaxis protein [Devosia yakushimensis]GLQ11652.1 hypothetical protein GCM10007913_35840 [Devosia yakushimensis]